MDENVAEFFTTHDGQSMLKGLRSHTLNQSLTRTLNRLTIRESSLSVPSVDVATSAHTLTLSLARFCALIAEQPLLRHAEVLTAEVFSEAISGVKHRFLVFEISRPDRSSIWMRLDRRAAQRDASNLSLLRVPGTAHAKDTVQLSSSTNDVLRDHVLELHQEFDDPPLLEDLACLLSIVSDELGREYSIWPENTQLYCAIVHQHLGGHELDHLKLGHPVHPNIVKKLCRQIQERIRLTYHIPTRPPATSLLTMALILENDASTADAEDASRIWDGLKDQITDDGDLQYPQAAMTLAKLLPPVSAQLLDLEHYAAAAIICDQRVLLWRALCAQKNGKLLSFDGELFDALMDYGAALQSADEHERACDVFAKLVTHAYALFDASPMTHAKTVFSALIVYAEALEKEEGQQQQGRLAACLCAAEALAFALHLFIRAPEQNERPLHDALLNLAALLQQQPKVDADEDDCDCQCAADEAAALIRRLFPYDCEPLCRVLRGYREHLDRTLLPSDGKDVNVGEECVAIARLLSSKSEDDTATLRSRSTSTSTFTSSITATTMDHASYFQTLAQTHAPFFYVLTWPDTVPWPRQTNPSPHPTTSEQDQVFTLSRLAFYADRMHPNRVRLLEYAHRMHDVGAHDVACLLAAESVELYRVSDASMAPSVSSVRDLTNALETYAMFLSDAGRVEEAAEIRAELDKPEKEVKEGRKIWRGSRGSNAA